MLKKTIKDIIATVTKVLARFCFKYGCIKQDDILDTFSHFENVESDAGRLKFFCPGSLTIWRAQTFFSKEPETINWIRSFDRGDSLLDVGANVGLYTVYAAKKGHSVMAVEPLSENYFILQKNIFINNIKNAMAFCACLYDENKISSLKIRNPGFGQAENSFDESLGAYGETYDYEYQQGVVGMTLDYFVGQTEFPNHLKIDVDGHELKVLHGAQKTLADIRLKSILIEVNEEGKDFEELCSLILKHGFKIAEKSGSELMNNDSYHMFKNYIFKR